MTSPAQPDRTPPRRGKRFYALLGALTVGAALAAVGIVALLTNIFERKQEGRDPFFRTVAITDTTQDPEVWGRNFPLQYDQYVRTVDQQRTRYGGSEAMPRTPTDADPRSIVAQSRLEEDPRLREFWDGYAFSKDFREERGHAYMLVDQEMTGRQQASPQPGACIHCHASVYVPYKRAGGGDLIKGFETLNPMTYAQARTHVTQPIACIDCHEPETMRLRVTRPGFIEGIRALKMSQGIANYDVNRDATRQEMRTYVCGQCHVEYYFRGAEKRLTYPWLKGLTVDSILAYYDQVGHRDFVHARSGAPILKAQHPEFELFNQGTHARAGVACADCHMPYVREGAQKISDHWVRSPLLNINRSCQTCHKVTEDELRQRVHTIQDRTQELRNVAIDAVLNLSRGIAAAARADSGNRNLAAARDYQRKAQFFADFVEAENSMGFHAPQEAARILARSIDYSRIGELALRGSAPNKAAPVATRRE